MRNFLKNISIYVIGYILIRAISFLLLPLYTNVFSEKEFGIYSLLFIFIAFSQFFYSYGMDASLMKFFVKSNDRNKIYSTIFISLFCSSTIFSVFIWVFSEQLSLFLLQENLSNLFKIASLILFLDSFSFRMLVIHRMEEHPYRYFVFTFTCVIITFLSNYYFIMKLGMGVTGALWATFFGSLSIFILTIPYLVNRISINKFSYSTLKSLLVFGFPFLPSIIFQMIIDFSDRQMLVYLTDIETVGLYSSSYKIASLMLFLISGFRLGWEPFFLKLKYNKSVIISLISNIVILFLISVLLFVILFIEPIIINSHKILFFSIIGENFWGSLPIIPIIMLGYVFLGLYYLQMPGIFYCNKTSKLPYFRFVGAFCNIVLNLLLIPYWGIYGAAIATSLSLILMTLPMFFYTNKLFKINYNWLIILFYSLYVGFIYCLNIIYTITFSISLLLFLIGISIFFQQIKNSKSIIFENIN